MNQGKYVFAQLIEFLSHNDFIRCVSKYQGNYKVKTFTCWHQLLYMIFGQLSNRDSLSDLIVCLQSQQNKSYHLGMGNGTSKANLAKANEKRDYRIYESFASILVVQAQKLAIPNAAFDLPIEAPVYAIDATVIDLCLNVFWWGKFRKHKAAVKLHTMLDAKTNIPTFIYITSGAVHEVNVLDLFPLEAGSYYLMDKGYIDFGRLHRIQKAGAFFVTRAKDNFKFVRLSSRSVDKSTGELFFKWIKQHLKVKTFWGYSFNAVKTQIYIAMITYLLVAL